MVVDRLTVKASAKRRLTDSVETALGLGGGLVTLEFVDLPEDDPHRERSYSEHLACPYDDLQLRGAGAAVVLVQLARSAPAPSAPASAPGWRSTPSWSCPTRRPSLDEGAIAPWTGAASVSDYFHRLLGALADAVGFRTDMPFETLPAKARRAILQGYDDQVHVRYKNRYGRERSVLHRPTRA